MLEADNSTPGENKGKAVKLKERDMLHNIQGVDISG